MPQRPPAAAWSTCLPGEYTTGAIHLKDNVNLHVEGGATLCLSRIAPSFQPAREP